MCGDDNVVTTPMEYRCFSDRLISFKHWKREYKKTPFELAENGFYFNNSYQDEVICFFCNLRMFDWHTSDDVLKLHLKYSKNCLYAKSLLEKKIKAFSSMLLHQLYFQSMFYSIWFILQYIFKKLM